MIACVLHIPTAYLCVPVTAVCYGCFYTSFVYECKGLQMPRNQVFMMGNLGRKWTHERRQAKEGRAEEGQKAGLECLLLQCRVTLRLRVSRAEAACQLHRLPFPFLDTQCPSYVPTMGTSPVCFRSCLWVISGADLKDN